MTREESIECSRGGEEEEDGTFTLPSSSWACLNLARAVLIAKKQYSYTADRTSITSKTIQVYH